MIKPQQVLACLIFALILTSICFAFFISYKHFNREDIDEDPSKGRVGVIKLDDENVDNGKQSQTVDEEEAGVDVVLDDEQSFLLKDDVTAEEVVKMKIDLESKVNSYDLSPGSDQPMSEVEAAILTKLAGSVDDLLASDVSVDDEAFETVDFSSEDEVGKDQFLDNEAVVNSNNDEVGKDQFLDNEAVVNSNN